MSAPPRKRTKPGVPTTRGKGGSSTKNPRKEILAPMMEPAYPLVSEDIQKALEEHYNLQRAEVDHIQIQNRALYADLNKQLRLGFHVIVHGLGSKKEMLEDFGKQYLVDGLRVVVNGYNPSMAPRELYDTIAQRVMAAVGARVWAYNVESKKSVIAQAQIVNTFFDRTGKRLFLIIHNIDELCRRSNQFWESIVALCAPPAQVHLIASADNAYTPMFINGSLNFVWEKIDTLLPYKKEAFEGRVAGKSSLSKDAVLAGAMNTVNALNKQGQQVFCIVAQALVAQKNIEVAKLYKICQEKLWLTSRPGFDIQIKELIDHKILTRARNDDREEILLSGVDRAILEELLQNFGEDDDEEDDDDEDDS